MPEKNLSYHEVEALLRATSGNDVKTASTKSWLRPVDVKQVLAAIDTDAEQVYIVGQGQYFNIKYRDDKVWLSPLENFVPCGWFTIRTLRTSIKEAHVIAAV